ncbi:MAG: prepilin-type N-terminal cleavage/methylation domain-containing protein [Hydrogenobaculum sp.]
MYKSKAFSLIEMLVVMPYSPS